MTKKTKERKVISIEMQLLEQDVAFRTYWLVSVGCYEKMITALTNGYAKMSQPSEHVRAARAEVIEALCRECGQRFGYRPWTR